MKTQKILLVVITIFIIGIFRLNAQLPASEIERRAAVNEQFRAEQREKAALHLERMKKQKVEKRIGNTVFELDTVIYHLNNKANKITSQEEAAPRSVSFNERENTSTAWVEHFKSVFSKERAEELNIRIGLHCVCDSTGRIWEVRMSFLKRENYEKFTLSEIKALEDAAKKYRLNISRWSSGEKAKYVSITYPFNPYLLYFEKPK